MLNLDQAAHQLGQSGLQLTPVQVQVLLETGVISGGVYDPATGSWTVPADQIAAYVRSRHPRRRWWVSLGAGSFAGIAALATLAGNLDEVTSFSCSQFGVWCAQDPGPKPIVPFTAHLSPDPTVNCPMGYVIPEDEQENVLALIRQRQGKYSQPSDVAEQVGAYERYLQIGTRNMILRLAGTAFTGTAPIIPANLRFEVERIAAAPDRPHTLYADECGGGLEAFFFDAVNLLARPEPYLWRAAIVNEKMRPVKLEVEPNKSMEILGRFECYEEGIYQVRANIAYDVAGAEAPPIQSNWFRVICPAEILAVTGEVYLLPAQRAVLDHGFYKIVFSKEQQSEADSLPESGPIRVGDDDPSL